jgi:hypothetical protein
MCKAFSNCKRYPTKKHKTKIAINKYLYISFSSIPMADKYILSGRTSVPFFRMQGTIVHYLGAITPAEGKTPTLRHFFLENNIGVTDCTGWLKEYEVGV